MWGRVVLLCIFLQATKLAMVESAKQQVQLSDSYLPVAMQVIAHLTDQMAYEAKDEPANQPAKPTAKPTIRPTIKPTNSWTKPPQAPAKPANDLPAKPGTSKPGTSKPVVSRPVTSKPYVFPGYFGYRPFGKGWSMNLYNPPRYIKPVTSKPLPPKLHEYASYSLHSDKSWNMGYYTLPSRTLLTTPFHRPGLFAPVAPPRPSDRNKIIPKTGFVLLPLDHNTQYTVIEPEETKTDEPLLSIQEEEVKPLVEPAKDAAPLLPPHFDAAVDLDKVSRAEVLDNEFAEENLQYLSDNVREMIKMANDPNDERVIDVWEGVRAGNQEVPPKGKLSSSNLRLLLLYDLLSREAKRLRLSDYSGYSPDVMKALVESSSGGARAQLSMALAKMVDRRDCEHEYANNRAKEMVAELAKDESKLSAELRYLQPLVYQF